MSEERFLTHFDVSASALTTERLKMRLVANNMANMYTTRTPEGGPYQRMEALIASKQLNEASLEKGVSVEKVVFDEAAPRLVFEPDHPDANPEGYVAYPNIDIVKETADLRRASLAYEANANVLDTIKKTLNTAIDIGG